MNQSEQVQLTPSAASRLADRLRRVEVAADDLDTVMDAAGALDALASELSRVVRNRDRLMRNRNNWKHRALTQEVEVVA